MQLGWRLKAHHEHKLSLSGCRLTSRLRVNANCCWYDFSGQEAVVVTPSLQAHTLDFDRSRSRRQIEKKVLLIEDK